MTGSGRVPGYRGKNTQTLSSGVYQALKSDIVTCRLAPGAVLFERGLAERLDTSKAPIREALKQLAQEGLFESRPSMGHFVASVTLKDVREPFQVRQILELGIATEAARAVTDEQLAELDRLVGDEFALDGEAARTRWHHQDVAFHAAIAGVLYNDRLVAAVRSAREGMYRLEYVNLSFRARPDDMVRDHIGIVQALRLRDGLLAAARMREATDGSLQLIQVSLGAGEPA